MSKRINTVRSLEITRRCMNDRMGRHYVELYSAFAESLRVYIRKTYPEYQKFIQAAVSIGVGLSESVRTRDTYELSFHQSAGTDDTGILPFPVSGWFGDGSGVLDIRKNPFSCAGYTPEVPVTAGEMWYQQLSVTGVAVTDAYYCSMWVPYKKESGADVLAARNALCRYAKKVLQEAGVIYGLVSSYSTVQDLQTAVPEMAEYIPEGARERSASVSADPESVKAVRSFLEEKDGC